MTRSQCVLFIIALFSLPVQAGSVEFAGWIPWDFLTTEIKKKEFFVQEIQASVRLNLGEIKPELKSVDMDLSGAIENLEFSDRSLHLDATGAVNLHLGEMLVDQLLIRDFGGNTIQVRIRAMCGPVTISIPSLRIDALFSLKSENKYLPTLQDLNYQIPIDGWSVTPIRCSGLSGIGEEIETTLSLALKNPALFSSLIKDWVSPLLDEWIRQQWLSVNSSEGQWSDIRIDSPNQKGFIVRGTIPLTSPDEISLPDNIEELMNSQSPRLYLSQIGYQTLIQDRMRVLFPRLYDLRENDSFRKLLGSRVMQYLVWPDLRKFNSATPFVLKNEPQSLLLSLKEEESGWKASLSGRGSLLTVIGGSPIDYIVYSMSVAVPVKMELTSGDLSFSTGKAAASFVWSFGYFYQLIYKPGNRIPQTLLADALSKICSDKKEKVSLPQFRAGDRDYMLSNLRSEGQFITMDLI